jgi:hypothetical protein
MWVFYSDFKGDQNKMLLMKDLILQAAQACVVLREP